MLKGHLGFKGESSTIDVGEKVAGVQTITVSDYRGTQTTTINDGELTGDMVVDNLTSDTTNRPLSAKQGKVLNTTIGDLSSLDTSVKSSVVGAINCLASGEIVDSDLSDNGYIKYSNGFCIQWMKKSATVTSQEYGSLHYADVSMNNWEIPFTTCFSTAPNVIPAQWIACNGIYSNTSPGMIRLYRPNGATSVSVTVYLVGIGTWK